MTHFETAQCLVQETLEVGIRQGLSGADLYADKSVSKGILQTSQSYNRVKVGFHQLFLFLIEEQVRRGAKIRRSPLTYVKIHLIEVSVGLENDIHVVQTCDL
jgi:hypothetical protein